MKDDILVLSGITKSFDDNRILSSLSLSVREDEFLTLLGPSGCGKTTLLRIIAGLEEPDEGSVVLEGANMEGKEPNERNVNTVFQNYALFPHMNVEKNIAYPLTLRHLNKKEIGERVKEMLSTVRLEGFEKRKIGTLSGGQKQRIALARSLVARPKVLLLDEPLGALDLKLRREMQTELKRIQKELHLTFIYITHDQEEALNMSDRIAVMKDGVIEQIGTPNEVYNHPKTAYVATFVGDANILKAKTLFIENGTATLSFCGVTFKTRHTEYLQAGSEALFALRREHLSVDNESGMFEAVVTEKSFVGSVLKMVIETKCGQSLTLTGFGLDSDLKEGDRVFFSWKDENLIGLMR
jgi:ABC-type spermidine/putrescine transport systems, ATPase components